MLRDSPPKLITIKEFSSDNDQDLYAADKEEQQRMQQHKQLQQRAAIPGMLTQQEMQEMQLGMRGKEVC